MSETTQQKLADIDRHLEGDIRFFLDLKGECNHNQGIVDLCQCLETQAHALQSNLKILRNKFQIPNLP